jgi:membrane associated rhomboid family serine protease
MYCGSPDRTVSTAGLALASRVQPVDPPEDDGGDFMFVPLHDYNPLENIKFQFVTAGLILTNFLVFIIFETGLVLPLDTAFLQGLAVVPAELFRGGGAVPAAMPGALHGGGGLPEPLTLITYMFLHDNSNYLHIAGNMLFLWVFGDNVEDAVGHFRFLIFYLLCGIIAGLTHALVSPESSTAMIGASGAVAGVIAAYLMLHPNVRVWVLAFMRVPLRISAGLALMVWIGLNIVSAYMAWVHKDSGGTAWWAHIGGLAAGAILIIFMRRPGIPLFDGATGLEPEAGDERVK